jgi:hypothetical protein
MGEGVFDITDVYRKANRPLGLPIIPSGWEMAEAISGAGTIQEDKYSAIVKKNRLTGIHAPRLTCPWIIIYNKFPPIIKGLDSFRSYITVWSAKTALGESSREQIRLDKEAKRYIIIACRRRRF